MGKRIEEFEKTLREKRGSKGKGRLGTRRRKRGQGKWIFKIPILSKKERTKLLESIPPFGWNETLLVFVPNPRRAARPLPALNPPTFSGNKTPGQELPPFARIAGDAQPPSKGRPPPSGP